MKNNSAKKVLILTERFFPEEFLINDLAGALKESADVEILTQTPSYPHDKVFDGYQNKFFQTTSEYLNIPVHRVKTYCGYNKSVLIKIFNYLNFALLTSLWALFCGWRYDRLFIYHTGPLTMATASIVMRFFWWKKCVIWTQDIWPDAVYAYGFKPAWWKKLLLDTFVKMIYAACDVITVSSPGFIDKLRPYTKKEVTFIPQWNSIRPEVVPCCKQERTARVFTFAGNIGSVQNLDMVVEVFGELKLKNCLLQLVGGGVFLEPLRQYAADKNITNIIFTGRLPQKEMPKIFAGSDIMIISLKSEFAATLPAKFQAYIAAGKPILGIIEGDTADLIKEYELGCVVPPQKEEIKKAFLALSEVPVDKIEQWGKNAAQLSCSRFDREDIIRRFENLLS